MYVDMLYVYACTYVRNGLTIEVILCVELPKLHLLVTTMITS